MDLFEGLNPAQRQAVETTEGPVMVMAGAGSGKTKVLTTRIAHIIKNLCIPAYSILAVTFTNKAANEMKERIGRMLDIDTRNMWISTFHSFCSRVLRYEIDALPPYSNKFTIIDDEDSLRLVKEIMKEEQIDRYKPKDIRNLISKSKNFVNFKIEDPDLNDCYLLVNRLYEQKCINDNLLDFDDLIIKTIELFKKNPHVLERYQYKFQYILVDEFQDTNTLQYNLMYMLASRHHNIFVVGDDFQSIYSFRGAMIENIHRFKNDYLEHKLILLEQNYRSTKEILDLANCVIDKNPNQIKKVMYSSDKTGQMPFYFTADSSHAEVMFVIDKIRELVASGEDYKNIAILYRANYISRNFEETLVRYQIPYTMYGGLSFFQRKEIKDLVAYLRLMTNYFDDFSFKRIVNEPKRKIGNSMIDKLSVIALDKKLSLFEAIDFMEGSSASITALKAFKSMIISLEACIESSNLKDLVDIVIEETGYLEMLKNDMDTYHDRYSNLKEFRTVLKEADEFYEGTNKDKLELLLQDLSLRTNNDDEKNDKGVILSTYHQVKGLEFNNVFMVAMEEEIFPSVNSVLSSELEEERRVCYVGITRAKNKLYITNCRSRFLFGCHRALQPSRFIKEMDAVLFKNITKGYSEFGSPSTTRSKLEVFDRTKEKSVPQREKLEFAVGDKIAHKAFGDGLVVAVKGEIISVAFKAPFGIKHLMGNHPAIAKINS